VELLLQLLVEVVENDSLPPETIDLLTEGFVDGDCLIEFLIGLVESILEDLYLLLECALILSPSIVPAQSVSLFNDFLLEVSQVSVYLILLDLLLVDLHLHLIDEVVDVGTLVEHGLSDLQLL
jgi:hypothetical protein